MNKHAYTIVGGKFRENKRVSLKKPVYNVVFALILVVWSKFPDENSGSLRFFTICGLKTLYKL